ncbi:hypothetical protein BSL78_21711 [Apostichopus japonicus]|uniref:Integrase zinc-binding domain-containing protein n=1 Tax=Stichopus japonicus TaxID=307972 RepID=A0A2G8K0A0_STIJA|nr:hypothetical protein BSL78_21711 [Apostichopus japonicus]
MERWRTGPEFLYSPVEMWPETDITTEGNTEDRERRKDHQVAMVEVDADCIDSKKYSKWTKLIRVTAYVQRFVRNLKNKCNKTPNDDESLPESRQILPKELEDAESFWVRKAQKPLHDRLKKGEFATLSPYIDEGIIRVGGRAGGDVVSYEQRHPVLLPHQCQIAKLIVRHLHEQGGHGGVASTSAMVRQKYWILGVQRIAKTVKFRCVVCRKAEHKVETQLMADLPPHRVAPFTPPFHFTACDYFGPYHVRVGRNKTTKHYGVILRV